ncbi:MAG: CsiV family protein [Pseudomonadota bacterium]
MHLRAVLAAAVLLLVALPARAETYRVDLIVFADRYAAGEAGAPARPVGTDGIALDDGTALSAAGIRLLPDSSFGLQEQWNRLRNSARFEPLIRLAWTQTDPPAENGPRLLLRYGQSLTLADPQGYGSHLVSPVQGTVALLLSRYLHLDADLRYTTPSGDGYVQYPLRERRRMRRDELHHLDSPRLGILARVSRAL